MVGPGVVVAEHAPGRFGRAVFFQVLEAVADPAQHPFGVGGPAVGERDHGPVEEQQVFLARPLFELVGDQPVGLGNITPLERRPHRLQADHVRRAAGQNK